MKGFYFLKNQPHILLWPVLAIGFEGEFWIGLGWINCEIGWHSGEDYE
jgi:hypothetical protein